MSQTFNGSDFPLDGSLKPIPRVFPQGGVMEEKLEEREYCYNVKLPDPHCQHCIWLEWNTATLTCSNRKRMICDLYIEEVFGSFISKTLN
jgi:hypothetical protein